MSSGRSLSVVKCSFETWEYSLVKLIKKLLIYSADCLDVNGTPNSGSEHD